MKKLLVIRLGALGDLIHASASFQVVKQTNPDVEIHLLTSPAYEAMAKLLPGVDQVWIWDKKQGWNQLFRVAMQLRRLKLAGVVNLHPSFKSLLFTFLLWPARQAIYHKQKLREKGVAQRAIPRRHAVADFYQPFRQVLNLPENPTLRPILKVPKMQKTSDVLWVGLIPGVGAKRSNRAWEPDAYVALILRLLDTDARLKIRLIGGPDEQPLAQHLVAEVSAPQGRLENYCGKSDIPGTACLLAQCDLVVGGDTGPMHLAAAAGVPLVSIYGPTSLARTGPMGYQPQTDLTPPATLACWPCELPECPYTGPDHLACMKQISVDAVLNACLSLLFPKAKP